MAALTAVGIASGTLNAVAGGGSFFTLPVLLFLGLPAADANGTNRVGVLAQSLGAVWGFHQSRVLDWRWSLSVSVPAVAGAVLGTWLAIIVPDFAFRRILSVVMLMVAAGTIALDWFGITAWSPHRQPRGPWHWSVVIGFFVAGVYGGFLQAGIGFLVLAITTVSGMDLVRGNAVKMVSVMLLTVVSLAIFAGVGRVQWPLGLALGAGNLLGGLIGVRIAVRRGHLWLQRVVIGATVLLAALLWVTD
jgi:uncharacterized membrane protein YfcA